MSRLDDLRRAYDRCGGVDETRATAALAEAKAALLMAEAARLFALAEYNDAVLEENARAMAERELTEEQKRNRDLAEKAEITLEAPAAGGLRSDAAFYRLACGCCLGSDGIVSRPCSGHAPSHSRNRHHAERD
jgi:hypothetical protein